MEGEESGVMEGGGEGGGKEGGRGVVWCGVMKLAHSPGLIVTSFSFVRGHLHMWLIVFICGWSFLFIGIHSHTWAVLFLCPRILYMSPNLVMYSMKMEHGKM